MLKNNLSILMVIAAIALATPALQADTDLKINSAHIENTNLYATMSANVTLSISNLSGDAVEYVRVRYRCVTEKGNPGSAVGITYNTEIKGYSILRSGETGNFNLYASFDQTGATGNYYLYIEVSPTSGTDPEINNNSIFSDNSAHYTAPRTDGADVVILNSGFWPHHRERNRPLTGAVEYLNNSTVAAQNLTIKFYLSTDDVINDSDMLLATFNKGNLDHKFYQRQNFETPIDPALPDGYYYGGVIISSSNDVDLSSNTGVSGPIEIGDAKKPTKGNISVNFQPSSIRDQAAWRLVGSERWYKHLEKMTNLEAGEYQLEFKEVEDYKTPANRTAVVTIGYTSYLNVTYQASKIRPIIEEFSVFPRTVYYGESAWLTWKVKNVDSVEIKPEGGFHSEPMGSAPVNLKESSTLTLTAKYCVLGKWDNQIFFTAKKKTRLKVKKYPEIKLFTSNSTENAPLHTSEPVILYWATGGGYRLNLDVNNETIADMFYMDWDGQKELQLDSSETVRLTIKGQKKEVSENLPVYITRQPIIRSFTVSPQTPVAGEEVTLKWRAPGLQTGVIEPLGVTISESQGEYRFKASESLDLTLYASNEYGETDTNRHFEVSDPGTDLSILWAPNTPPGAGKKKTVRIEGGSQYTVGVTLINNGTQTVKDFCIAMYADGILVDKKLIDIDVPNGQLEGIQLTYIPVKTGKVKLEIVADPEGAVPDNNRSNNTVQMFVIAENPKGPSLAVSNIQIKRVGSTGGKNIVMLDFDVAEFSGKGRNTFYYESLVYRPGEEKPSARLDGLFTITHSKSQAAHLMRLLKIDDESLNGDIEISVKSLRHNNGFIDVESSRRISIPEILDINHP